MKARSDKYSEMVKELAEDMLEEFNNYLNSVMHKYSFTLKPAHLVYNSNGNLVGAKTTVESIEIKNFDGNVMKYDKYNIIKDGYMITLNTLVINSCDNVSGKNVYDIDYDLVNETLDNIEYSIQKSIEVLNNINKYKDTCESIKNHFDDLGCNVTCSNVFDNHYRTIEYKGQIIKVIFGVIGEINMVDRMDMIVKHNRRKYKTTIRNIFDVDLDSLENDIRQWKQNISAS